MKNIIKGSVLVALLTVVGLINGYSQASVGLEVGIPLGDFGDASNVGFGASFRYDGSIQDKLSWTATGGYSSFGLKGTGGGYTGHTSMIPIMGGVKYYFQESDKGVYTGADLGLVFVSVSVDLSGYGSSSASETRFGFSPVLGYRMGKFDVAARYHVVSDFNNFGIRLAYVFVK